MVVLRRRPLWEMYPEFWAEDLKEWGFRCPDCGEELEKGTVDVPLLHQKAITNTSAMPNHEWRGYKKTVDVWVCKCRPGEAIP